MQFNLVSRWLLLLFLDLGVLGCVVLFMYFVCMVFGFFFGFPFYKEHGVVLIIAHSLPTSYLTCLVAQSNLLPYKVSGYFKSILYKSKDFLKVLPIWLLNDDVTLCQD